MKKINKILLLIMSLALILAFVSGCSWINIDYGKTNNGINNSGGTNSTQYVEDNSIYSLGVTYDVKENGAKINVARKLDTELSLTQLRDKVYESVVVVRAGSSLGSGVIVDISVDYKDPNVKGMADEYYIYVLSCHHVIEGATTISVSIPFVKDATTKSYDYYTRSFSAALIGSDAESDICILKINLQNNVYGVRKSDIVKASVCSDYVEIGEEVVAIGNPTGNLPGSFTSGEISGTHRTVTFSDSADMELIQISAPINPGNSGGGLFNSAGQLIGMVNSGNPDSQNIGFAIPATGDLGIIDIVTELIETSSDRDYGYIKGRILFGSVGSTSYYNNRVQVTEAPKGSMFYNNGLTVGTRLASFTFKGVKYNITSTTSFINQINSLEMNIGDTITFGYYPNNSSTVFETTFPITQYIYASRLES